MANKAIFSYGNNGKRKIGHSKFDMGHEHIMSGNFGALLPAACFETLPDDYWDVSDNTVTLLKPLTAPAFTRINQNFYGAYVRNQQIWKYWNDFISNGTAFGDVYGNNVTNQNLQNVWKVPSIPTPYLQTILKIGYGNATPVHVVTCSCNDSSPYLGDLLAQFIMRSATWNNVANDTVYRITDAVQAMFCQQSTGNPALDNILERAKLIGFQDYAYDVWMYHGSSDNKYHYCFHVYCSLRQWLAFYNMLLAGTSTSTGSTPSQIGSNESDSFMTSGFTSTSSYWRFFADEISADPSTSESAFLIEKSNYEGSQSTILKSLDYYPRLIDSSVDSVSVSAGGTYDFVFQSIQSAFWGFRYRALYFATPNKSVLMPASSALSSFDPSSDFYWEIDTTVFGYPAAKDFTAMFEGFGRSIHYLGVTCAFDKCFSSFNGDSAASLVATYSTTHNYYTLNSFGGNIITSYNIPSNFRFECYCDLSVPLVVTPAAAMPFQKSFSSRESQALGYDALSMVTYLCQNSSILMENFGIKSDPLSARPFYHYRFETTNSLPFFAYSKIWGDNFRNSVVSSPEIDYSESNGEIFADQAFYQHFVFGSQFREPAVRPTRYQGKVYTDFTYNGWTLEITTFPRNSQGSKIHTHLPIKSFSNVFTFLIGSNFDGYFQSLSNTDLNVFEYYVPTYYNGLLHLKYQNFNKDYFTSALLDPMSGANQVSVGSTINELRENEAKQHWWERTAMYRSIKSWFQGTYGITPIELPEDSRITGTDHVDVNIGEVIQTSGTTPESPQGQRSGLGGCRGSGTLVHGHANEHGWIIILVSHTVESQYMQVYDKMWDVKDSFLDYPTVDFASVGNESILQKEVNYTTVPTERFDWNFYALASTSTSSVAFLPVAGNAGISYRGKTNPLRKVTGTTGKYNIASAAGTSLDNIFGFIPRYSSYKFKFDQVSGQFRHELRFWHTFKRYLTSPILCHEFVNWEMAADDEEINRIFAVSDDLLDDKFNIDCFINAHVDRALPFVCVPMSK